MKTWIIGFGPLLRDSLEWIDRCLTTPGKCAVFFVVAAGLSARDQAGLAAPVATAIFASALLAAVLAAPFFRIRFSARRILPARVQSGDPLTYPIVVKNLSHKNQAGLELLENLPTRVRPNPGPTQKLPPLGFRRLLHAATGFRFLALLKSPRARPIPLPTVEPASEMRFETTIRFLRRGRYLFQNIVLARPDPLGLVRTCSSQRTQDAILVHPRRCQLPHSFLFEAPPQSASRSLQDNGVSQESGGDFAGLREYRCGDPARHIHWRSWARLGRVFVRHFEQPKTVRIAILLDSSADSAACEVFEGAVRFAASWIEALCQQGFDPTLICLTPDSTADRPRTHAQHGLANALETLSEISPLPRSAFSKFSQHATLQAAGYQRILCILPIWDSNSQQWFHRLLALCRQVEAYVIVEKLPAPPHAALPGACRGGHTPRFIALSQLDTPPAAPSSPQNPTLP